MLLDTPLEWTLGLTAAFLFGFSKTGIAGVGIVGVTLMAMAVPAKDSVGLVLPVLMFCDVFAVAYYRRHAQWRHLVRLIPAALAGIVAGWLAMGHIPDHVMPPLIGVIVLTLVAFGWLVKRRPEVAEAIRQRRLVAVGIGALAGMTTMLANAAGPIMVVYLLAMGLPKRSFIGTGAWYFLVLNWVKVPFMADLDIINAASLKTNLLLFPIALVGVGAGIVVLNRISQKRFDSSVTLFAVLAGLMLIFKSYVFALFERVAG